MFQPCLMTPGGNQLQTPGHLTLPKIWTPGTPRRSWRYQASRCETMPWASVRCSGHPEGRGWKRRPWPISKSPNHGGSQVIPSSQDLFSPSVEIPWVEIPWLSNSCDAQITIVDAWSTPAFHFLTLFTVISYIRCLPSGKRFTTTVRKITIS